MNECDDEACVAYFRKLLQICTYLLLYIVCNGHIHAPSYNHPSLKAIVEYALPFIFCSIINRYSILCAVFVAIYRWGRCWGPFFQRSLEFNRLMDHLFVAIERRFVIRSLLYQLIFINISSSLSYHFHHIVIINTHTLILLNKYTFGTGTNIYLLFRSFFLTSFF